MKSVYAIIGLTSAVLGGGLILGGCAGASVDPPLPTPEQQKQMAVKANERINPANLKDPRMIPPKTN